MAFCLLLAASACGGGHDAAPVDGSIATPNPDAPGRDAPVASPDAAPDAPPRSPDAAPDAPPVQDAAPPGDGAPVGSGLISNTPGATAVDISSPAIPELQLLSSNVVQELIGNQVFQSWFGDVKNVGSTTICFAQVDARFLAEDGTELAAFDGYAFTGWYVDALGRLPCLAPGQIGTFWDNGLVAAAAPLARVTQITLKFVHEEFGDSMPAPAANEPAVDSHVASVPGGFGVTGTITGRSTPVHDVMLYMFPRDANGLVFDAQFADDGETLNPGSVFPFTTLGTPTAFSQYRVFSLYSNGPKPAGAVAPAARSTVTTARDAVVANLRQLQQDVRARAALAATTRTAH